MMTQLVTPTEFVLQHEPYPERWQEAEPDERGVRGPCVRMAAVPGPSLALHRVY